MRHLDLFSGIGGFALAASRVFPSHQVVSFCDIEPFAQKVLKKHWPDVPCHDDIKTMKGSDYANIDLLTGGFPCQPFSQAGQRRGTEDDRHLWPEMLRVIREAKPRWIVGENVRGLTNWNGGVVFDEVLSDLENIGYSVQSFLIPACAVDAQHRRDRVWIVGFYSPQCSDTICTGLHRKEVNERGCKQWGAKQADEQVGESGPVGENVANTTNIRQEQVSMPGRNNKQTALSSKSFSNSRGEWAVEPSVSRVAARLSSTLDETIKDYGYENRSHKEAITTIDNARRSIMQQMWEEQYQAKPASHRATPREGDDLVYKMSCLRTHERWKLGQRFEVDPDLRDM